MLKKLAIAISLLICLLHATVTFAQERVRVGWAAMTASHTPLWVAQEKGLLAKQGLLVESIFFGAGPPAMQALVAGDLDIVVTSAPNVVNPRLGGVDAVMILSIIPTFIDHIISAANITSPEQLKGKIGSVNRFGSISEMGLRLSLRRLGIDPDKDVRIVTREAIIKTKRPVAAKFARAITEAIHLIKADKETTKAIIGKYTKFTDPEGLERTYRNYTSVLLDVPYADPAGMKTLLDDMAPKNPKAAAADPKSFVDASFVQEMEASGFIKQLSRR